MMTTRLRPLLPVLAITLAGTAFAADVPTEAPYVGDPVTLTADQRVERSLRTIQVGLERSRSDLTADQDIVVCFKQAAIGSHRQVINCATNRFWRSVREDTLASLGGPGGSGGANKNDKVFTMSADDYYKLEKRFGKLPADLRDLAKD